jgi:hypothetical protein
MAASAEAARLITKHPGACSASEASLRWLLDSMDVDEDVYGVGNGVCAISRDGGPPALYVVTSAGIRATELLSEGDPPQFIRRAEISGQDWTPLSGEESLVECYGGGGRIIFRVWLQGRPDATALEQIDTFSRAVERLGVDNPRGRAND